MSLGNTPIQSLKFLSPQDLHDEIAKLTSGMLVTKGVFELVIPQCTLQDIEWNHMDQMHRQCVHHTYEKNVRIALSNNFALSLTQWGKWPFLIPVTDVYVARGLFYQSLTLAGIIFLHSVISMEEAGDAIRLKDEWLIASHRIFRLLHKPLHKKLFKLNERLQQEDQEIRQKRFFLRKKGFHFHTDTPDYYNSNSLTLNTIYPKLDEDHHIALSDFTDQPSSKKLGNLEFILKKEKADYLIWPGICPHEGGPLANGKFCESHVSCPWHGLRFNAVRLSKEKPSGAKYGFEYQLLDTKIAVSYSRSDKNPLND